MRYDEIKSLEKHFRRVEVALLKEENWHQVNYPAEFTRPWNPDRLTERNENLLSAVAGCANVYAISTAPAGSTSYALRYIGKTTRSLARQRIRNHLIKKDSQTGAKLSEVQRHVLAGGSVRIAWVTLEPESLRGYIEEELIQSHPEADWNRENS